MNFLKDFFASVFRDWRGLDTSTVNLELDPKRTYHFMARACGLKGWLGGTHSWMAFFTHEFGTRGQWVVFELSDRETLRVQGARILCGTSMDDFEMAPFLSNRDPRQKWFGASPVIVDSSVGCPRASQVASIARVYPFRIYKLLTRNCNTFFSYACFKLGLRFRRPIRSVGYCGLSWWNRFESGAGLGFFAPMRAAFLLLFMFGCTSGTPASKSSLSSRGAGVAEYAQLFGVSIESLKTLAVGLHGEGAPGNGKCDQADRHVFIDCVGTQGRRVLNAELYSLLFQRSEKMRRSAFSPEAEKSLQLYNYVMDLTRENLSRTRKANWFVQDKFTDFTKPEEFPYEDGDLVLAYGSAALSTLIGKLSSPSTRLSHALIVRKRGRDVTTIEALPHSGAKEFPFEQFKNEKYRHIKVLRWVDKKTRAQIAARASDFSEEWAIDQVPFDMKFKSQDELRVYCTMMAALAYARASNMSLEKLFPDQDSAPTSAFTGLARSVGVDPPERFISPTTLLRSKFFETVAEFRDHENLVHAWEIEAVSDLSAAKHGLGYEIKPTWFFANLETLFALPFVDHIAFLKKNRTIARGMGVRKFASLATLEKKITETTIELTNENLTSTSLLDTPLWEMRAVMEHVFARIAEERFIAVSNQVQASLHDE